MNPWSKQPSSSIPDSYSAVRINCNPYNNVSEQFTAEFPINDYPDKVRFHITSEVTLQKLRIETGAVVELRGTFIHEDIEDRCSRAKLPHLVIKSIKKEYVERAIANIVKRVEEAMNQPYYQEKFQIGEVAFGPGFDPAKHVAGEGNSNLKYIYSETGADVTVRGRGSGYIEPRTGRESSHPLYVLVQHDSSYEAFQKACRLVKDLIETVKEDWGKLQWKQPQPQGKEDLYWQEEKQGSSRAISHLNQMDERESRDFRGEEVRAHRGEGRDRDQNFRGLYDDRQELDDGRGDQELDWRGNVWGSSRDSDKNSHVEDSWLRGRDYADKHQRNLEPEDHLKRGEWQTTKELGMGNRCESDKREKGERATSSTRQLSNKWGEKSWTPEDEWSGRHQQEERRWNNSGLHEENPNMSNEKKDEWFWDSGLQKERLNSERDEVEDSRTKWPWDSGQQEEKVSWRNDKEDNRTERELDRGRQKEIQSRKYEKEDSRTKWSWDSGLQEEKLSSRNKKEDYRTERQSWEEDLQKEKMSRWNKKESSRTEWSWDSGLQEEKQSKRSKKEDDRSSERWRWDDGLQKEKLSRWNENDSDRRERSWSSGLQGDKLGKDEEGCRFQQQWDENVRAQKDKNKDHQDLGNKKKSRWDTTAVDVKGASVFPDKNVLTLVLDQKKNIEEKLEINKKGFMPFGELKHLAVPLLNSVPQEINPNQLQNLNHRQLLEISQQQQSLLLQLSANLFQQGPLQAANALSSNSLTNFQVNPMLNFPSNPLYNFQPLNPVPPVITEATMPLIVPPFKERVSPELVSERFDRKQILNEDSSKDVVRYPWTGPSTSRRQSPPRQWQKNENPTYSGREINRQSSERTCRSPMFRNSPTRRSSSFTRNSPPRESSPITNSELSSLPQKNSQLSIYSPYQDIPRGNSPIKKSEFSSLPQKNSQLQIYSPYKDIPSQRLSPRGGSERYSPQLNDGQERYSPQLEEDSRLRSPELYSRREDQGVHKSKKPKLEEKKQKKLLRYRVAVIDKKMNKLTPQDEEEIKKLVYKKLKTLPVRSSHHIDFLGFGSQDFVFVILPRSLEGMKWLVDIKELKSECKFYTLFPYEDIYNKFRMKSILSFDLLEGYRPKPEEVILELGRMNSGLCTEMWKIFKFFEEKKGFFLEVSVDFLSYLRLNRLHWKPCYRVSSIRLEPVRPEILDRRFGVRS